MNDALKDLYARTRVIWDLSLPTTGKYPCQIAHLFTKIQHKGLAFRKSIKNQRLRALEALIHKGFRGAIRIRTGE